MKGFLHELELNSFRGASQSAKMTFDKGKRIALIFGNNGTGKSTICDALDFIGCSSIGSLGDKKFGGGGTDKAKFIPSIGRKAVDVSVRLKCEDGEWTATLGKRSVSIAPGPHDLDVRVLRRSNILRIVQANPSDRYVIMQEFMDLSKAKNAEDALREAAKSINTRMTNTSQRLRDAESELQRHWVAAGSQNGTSRAWAKAIVSKTVSPPVVDSTIGVLRNIQTCITRLKHSISDWNSKNDNLKKAEAILEEADTKVQQAIKDLSNQEPPDVLQTLERAEQFITQHLSDGNCPVCATPFPPGELLARIKARIQGMREIQSAQRQRDETQRKRDTSKSLLDNAKDELNKSLMELRNYRELIQENAYPTIRTQMGIVVDGGDSATVLASLTDQINKELELLQQAPKEYETFRLTKQAIEPLLQEIETIEQSQPSLDAANTRIAEAVKVVEATRKGYVDEVLLQISGEANRMYKLLHPNEKLGGIRLSVREKGQGSVEMSGEFHNQTDIPPEAFFSDSHLDTLGVCIFLALAKAKGNTGTILVMDDIISSVDSEHAGRLVELLAKEAESFGHIVITTHLELLEEWFRHHKKASSQTQFFQIADWSLTEGFRMISRQFQTDLLRSMLVTTPFDKQSVGMKAGFLLETLLKQIGLSFSVWMPLRTPQRYTLAEFLQALDSDWRNTRIIVKGVALAAHLDLIESTAWVRNVLAHGNSELALQLPDADVRNFAGLVLKFNDEFCEEIPSRKRQPC